MRETIGFIGAGNMGKAMIEGICQNHVFNTVWVCDHHQENLDVLHEKYGVETSLDEKKVAKNSDVLVLSVKPKHYSKVIEKIKDSVKSDVIIVDIAAGVTILDVKTYFGKDIKVIKAMPNTPALVLSAMSAISFDDLVTEEDKVCVQSIFNSFGKCEVVEETMMDAVTSVSGSSPAYVFMFIEAMADAAVAQGLPRTQAYTFAAQAVLGSAKMVLETGMHPGTLKDMVCSPGGTTIDAVCELERMGFRASVESAMRVCGEKSKKMTEGNLMSTWKKIALWKKILIGVVIGLIIGFVSPAAAEFISPLGDIFLRMLKMLIVPLVFFSITSGICKMGDVKQLRTVGVRYVLWIVVSAVIAATCGVIAGLIVQPGKGTTEFLAAAEAAEAQSYSFIDNVIGWFPTNIVESMANANMLQIIMFCMFLGVALLALGDKAKTVIKFIDEGSEVMLKITEYVIAFSPFGIMSLIATMVSTISGAMMKEVIVFLITDNVVCLVILVLVYPLITKLVAKLPGYGFMRKIAPAILVAASTSSSAATLPVSIKISEEDLGIPENIYGFTLPLGNTTGMTGFAVFVGLCCVFASNLYGFPITVSSIIQFVFFGLILSIGAAGVKGAGVVMSGVLLEALGMPLTLIPILAAIWPVIDPAHTTLNNVGDLVGTAVVARSLDRMDMDVYNKK